MTVDVDLTGCDDDGLTFRPLTRDDDAGMRAVNAEVFPANPKARAEITAWQWWDNPFGDVVGHVWVDDATGTVVGQYLAYPMPAVFDGRPGRIAIGVDFGVATSHQGRRLAKPLLDATFARATETGHVFYSYPNEQSVRAGLRAGLVEVATLEVRVLPLPGGSLGDRLPGPDALGRAAVAIGGRALGARLRTTSGIDVAVVDDPPEDLDALWGTVAPHQPWGVARHHRWWRWRYAEHPDRPYTLFTARRQGTLVGAAAVRTRDDLGGTFACLLELLTEEPGVAKALVSGVRDHAEAGVDGIAATGVPASLPSRMSRAAGLVTVPDRLLPRPVHFCTFPHPEIAPDPASLPWTTAWGDLDHI